MLDQSSSNDPFFTVVIPCYNRADEVGFAIESLLRQTCSDFECILVDDGSENSKELEHLIIALDARFKYIYQENRGGGAARNKGINAAKGQYIAFLDSDDYFLPTKLAKIRAHIDKYGSDALYSPAFVDRGSEQRFWIRPDRSIGAEEDVGEYLFVANQFIQTSTIVIKSGIAKKVLFNPSLRKGQDLDFCVRAYFAGVRFVMLDEPLVVWRDVSEFGRTSRHSGVAVCEEWLQENSHRLTYKAVVGYRATVLSYYQPKWKIANVLWDLTRAYFVAGVSLKVTLRQLLRFMFPRRLYRVAVDAFVKMYGKQASLELRVD